MKDLFSFQYITIFSKHKQVHLVKIVYKSCYRYKVNILYFLSINTCNVIINTRSVDLCPIGSTITFNNIITFAGIEVIRV